ncbi:MAG: CoB--CoM heterodisulfide reductase iron-sulfur subunit A family protein [Bryobacteraceae bacterium]|nr:CoB--CoM heterodisulfide reductase iron-sulfur subunit A family protein [Bryobacteraceae bacterium]
MSARAILVVGGGISGITAAVEAAEAGRQVVLIEKSPFLGGRVTRTHLYFPKLCPPACGLEINYKRIRNNPAITVLTQAELESLAGTPGSYQATVKIAPRFVTSACTACGACAEACPAERPDDFNYGLKKTKAAYIPAANAFPPLYAIDRPACPNGCRACVDACRYGAIDLDQPVERRTFDVAAVIAATGWAPYDAAKIDNLGFGRHPNVVTNVIMERMAARDGPTGGRILRPSDGRPPRSVVFVQCAGSRDDNHLPYCSAVCCAASLKQATYVRTECPEADVSIFYIDIRAGGRLEDFYARVAADDCIKLIKGKVAKVEAAEDGDLLVTAEDALQGRKRSHRASLVVLATGIVPQSGGLPAGFVRDEFQFLPGAGGRAGLYSAGCVRRPEEVMASVQDATGAALEAIQDVVRGAVHG